MVRTRVVMTGVPERPEGTVDLLVEGVRLGRATTTGGDVIRIDPSTGTTDVEHGGVGTLRFVGLPPGDKDVELWLPHGERVELVALRTDAPLIATTSGARPVWLHHGSSLSQGSGAAGPSSTWPAVAATAAGVELVNLGLGGSAMLDQLTARTMRDTDADVISVKIGINLVNLDVFRLRAFGPAVHGFLDTLRDGHPGTPLLVVGPAFCPIHETTPGPSTFDPAALATGRLQFLATGDPADAAAPTTPLSRLTLTVIRAELATIMSARTVQDSQLFYLDGRVLFGETDFAGHPLPDGLHPGAASHEIMGDRFAHDVFDPGGPFAAVAHGHR